MTQQQADLSRLREGAVMFFRSYGLSFSDGLNALLNDVNKPDPTDGNTGKTINAIARSYGLTNKGIQSLCSAFVEGGKHDTATSRP